MKKPVKPRKVKLYTQQKAGAIMDKYRWMINDEYFFDKEKRCRHRLIDIIAQGSGNRLQVLCVSSVLDHIPISDIIAWNGINITAVSRNNC